MVNLFSRAGSCHGYRDAENQDAVLFRKNDRFSVITLADGISVCSAARKGAEAACAAVTDILVRKGGFFMKFDQGKTVDFLLSHILYELKKLAEQEGQAVEEYSSTIASVLVDHATGKMLCFSLGTSLILAAGNGRCRVLTVPSDSTEGCCCTTTVYAADMAQAVVTDAAAWDIVLICSDGAWRLMYDRGHLNEQVREMLLNQECARLECFIEEKECADDYSCISMNLQELQRRQIYRGKTVSG
ncbi:MAG: protein phosphatase 2C domain-containing protein [Ruminococcus sp.]|nr:protein phosphatase 2C domain-containing protein [Ruminococcus sp.]